MKEQELISHIRENTRSLFDEDIRWDDNRLQLPRNREVDLAGVDSDGLRVIVEVKTDLGKPGAQGWHATFESIGQVLNYANAYMKAYKPSVDLKDSANHLRLFIVGPIFSQTVEDACDFLRRHGVNIRHIPTHV
ncbi:MAG: hypothetical protein OXN27_13160 [Candidatus Poribacteria bacterium]|nr:hypothetical protein [Candidatus Poribacteria bacterium]